MTPPQLTVKICGLTNEADARVALEAGAAAIGFNFYSGSPRCISLKRAAAIASEVAGDYLRVGVFVNPEAGVVLEALRAVPLDIVQLHGPVIPALPPEVRVWRAIAPAPAPPDGEMAAEAYLLDTPSRHFGGTGMSFSWQIAAGFRGRAILAGGLHPANVGEAIRVARPWGVDACSRLERAPGKKDPELVRAFVAAALSAHTCETVTRRMPVEA